MGLGRSNRPASALHPCRRSSMDRAPVYEAGCSRFDPWRRRLGVSPASQEACASRRSSSGQSAALRRRRQHVRVVPARLWEVHRPPERHVHALVAQRLSTPLVWVRTGFDPQRGLSSHDPPGPPGGGGTGRRRRAAPSRRWTSQPCRRSSTERAAVFSTARCAFDSRRRYQPSRPAVVAQRTERPHPKRQGARSSRAGGTRLAAVVERQHA